MNGRAIRIVYGKELRDSLRDRRTIISMIVIPVVVVPLLMFGVGSLMFKTMTKARQEVPHVMIIGGENSPKVLSALHAAKSLQIIPATAGLHESDCGEAGPRRGETAAGFRCGGCPRRPGRGGDLRVSRRDKIGFCGREPEHLLPEPA